MNTWTVSGTVLINNRRIVCKGERKRVVLVKGSKWDVTNTMKAQLNVVSHEMCSEFYHRQCTRPESREWRSPRRHESFLFSEGSPLILKRIKVNRVHIPDWDDGEFVHADEEESFGLFGLKFSLFLFLKVKANVYNSSFSRYYTISGLYRCWGRFLTSVKTKWTSKRTIIF